MLSCAVKPPTETHSQHPCAQSTCSGFARIVAKSPAAHMIKKGATMAIQGSCGICGPQPAAYCAGLAFRARVSLYTQEAGAQSKVELLPRNQAIAIRVQVSEHVGLRRQHAGRYLARRYGRTPPQRRRPCRKVCVRALRLTIS